MPKVFVVNRPIRNKFGWTPDLSDHLAMVQ